MRSGFLFLVFAFFIQQTLSAQSHTERIYIQTDRSSYQSGETIYFKGLVVSDNDTIESTNLFVELWDKDLKKISGTVVPVIDASGAGSIVIPKSNANDPVILRAYTDITNRQTDPFQYVKAVSGNLAPVTNSSPLFYPEGGVLLVNADNYITVKTGPSFSGVIRNQKGEEITKISTGTNGLGSFKIRPLPGENFVCVWMSEAKENTTALPNPVENSIAVHVTQSPDTLYFHLDNGGTTNSDIQKPKVQLLIGNELAYLVELNMTKASQFSYFIPLSDFKAGLAELNVLDNSGKTLASRPLFIAKKSFEPVAMDIVKKDLAKRGENSIVVKINDTTLRNISVSITDAQYNESIFPAISGLYIDALPSLLDKENYLQSLDLALQTTTVAAESKKTVAAQQGPRHLQLTGYVKRGNKILANKEVLVGVRSAYTGKELYKVITDNEGKFVLDGVILYGDVYVHCRLPKSDDELTCTFTLSLPTANDDVAFLQSFRESVNAILTQSKKKADITVTSIEDTLVFENAIVLEEVVVKTDQNQVIRKRLEDLEKKYIDQTQFAGYYATGETLDVMNDPQSVKSLDLFSYIGANMRSVSLRFERGVKQLHYFGRGTSGQTRVSSYYLGNMKVDRDMLDGITLDQVAVIKFIPMLGSEPGLPPALAVFLKKPGDQGYWEKDKYQAFEQTITGYPVSKDFVAPNYSDPEVKVQSDQRKTILWQPYTALEKGTATIKFFNNDRAKKLRIVVEGVREDGSIVYEERVLE